MEVSIGDVVMPGDKVKDIDLKKNVLIVLGPGLRRDAEVIFTCKSGILRKKEPNVYYVDSYQKRYVPCRGENVVGVVTQKTGDVYKVDIGASELATLSYLSFEGATKKNRPDVHIGDVVFAKLLVASKDMESELVCIDPHGKKKKLGILKAEGMLFTCSLSLVRKLLNPKCQLFPMLARNQAYELAIGMNGKIWIKGRNVQETIAIANAILAAEFVGFDEMQSLCADIENKLLMSRQSCDS